MSENKLLVFDRNQLVQEFKLERTDILIGREPANDLVIKHPEVSRRHARLYNSGRGWLVENLSSSNHVRLHGQIISGPVAVENNDQFELSPSIVIRLVLEATPTGVGQGSGVMPVVTPDRTPSYLNLTQPYPASQAVMQASQAVKAVTPTGANPNWQQPEHGGTVLMDSEPPTLKISYLDGYREVIYEYKLTKPRMKIGRSPDNDIVVPISTVSREHAQLRLTGGPGVYSIFDNGSTNGLLYKGSKVTEKQLVDGDVIRIGDEYGNVATLTFEDASRPVSDHVMVMQLPVGQQTITIGRTADNALVLNYPQVSAHHAVIQRSGSREALLQDLGSINGTFVRGQRVLPNAPQPIHPGEVFQIAGYQLVYEENTIVQPDAGKVRIDAINIRKTVNNGALVLLNNISLSIKPKEFVALVGGSGAGKSTLMDALNGFRPSPEGTVLLNGEDYYQNFAAYRSSLGYVPQDDIIHRELTVEQALYYVAKLRLPKDTTEQEIEHRVAEVLEDVEMSQRRKVEVSRLSGGQRKRVSIAVELLAKPNLLFLDEPTSGLDPGLDKRMMFLLRRLADQGRTIILVTHATSNITACDKVVFLAPGGKLCFFGPPAEALDFFEVKEFADIYSKLEQTPTSGDEWEAKFRQSPYYQKYITEPLGNVPPPRQTQNAPATGKAVRAPKVSGWRQFTILARRYANLLRRDRINLLVLILQAPIIGGVLALVAKDKIFEPGARPFGDAQQVLFMLSIAAVWLGTSNAAREITKETPIYLRERLVNLQVFPYMMSKVAILTLLCLLQSLLLIGIVLLRTGVPTQGAMLPAVLELFIGVWLATMGGLAMGLLVSSLASNTDKAISIVPIILIPQIILAGVIFELSGPSKVLSYATITKWSLDSLGTSADLDELYYNTVVVTPPPPPPAPGPDGAAPPPIPAAPGKPDCNTQVKRFDVNDYAGNPCGATRAERGLASHLLGRWGILLGMIVFFLGLSCFFQKRKDKAWQRK
jgi:ABC-type multidrug transport system ATPase subunit/pSer/pThr/pTyr-binding forkhead associated (FHA) protein